MFALHLVVEEVPSAIDWYQNALGASLTRALRLPDGSILIADLDVGGLPIAIAASVPGTTLATPASTGVTSACFRLTVEDADAAMARATEAGATVFAPLRDAFWGVRTGEVLDPAGHRWAFDQPMREVSDDEIERQLAAMYAGH